MQVPLKLAGATRTGHRDTTGFVHSMGRAGVMGWDAVKSIAGGGRFVRMDGILKSIPGCGVQLVG